MDDSDEMTSDLVLYVNAAQQESASHANDPDGADEAATASTRRHWRPALTRWLLTLNPGRTQDEYEKAARYFFETPGVPQDLADLSYDLLLAYRGALALRADRRRRSMPRRAATSGRLGLRHPGAWAGALPGSSTGFTSGFEASHAQSAAGAAFTPASQRVGPLSPATVNIRLTALRQFLLFAIEQGLLTTLTAEQTRSALRRLRNDRRRPYQMLAEDEWGEFLQAALTPPSASTADTPGRLAPAAADAGQRPPAPAQPLPATGTKTRGPWGVTRAARAQAHQQIAEQLEASMPPAGAPAEEAPSVARAHDGRTGARTAQRDHALISLALATGLRAIELSLLDVGDLVSERRRGQTEWWLSLPDEKTKGQHGGRVLPLAPELMATLLAYIRSTGRAWEQPTYRATPLFLALDRGRPTRANRTLGADAQALMMPTEEQPERRYRRLRPEQIRGVIHRVEAQWLAQRRAASDDPAETAEARRISPHTLRHSAAIALLLGDEATERPPASVEHVRGWLGHFDIRTTQRYLSHLESREQRRRFAIHPQGRKPPDTSAPSPDAQDRE